jgi:hypothetical protein
MYDWKTPEYKKWTETYLAYHAGNASADDLAEAEAATTAATLAWKGEHYYG